MTDSSYCDCQWITHIRVMTAKQMKRALDDTHVGDRVLFAMASSFYFSWSIHICLLRFNRTSMSMAEFTKIRSFTAHVCVGKGLWINIWYNSDIDECSYTFTAWQDTALWVPVDLNSIAKHYDQSSIVNLNTTQQTSSHCTDLLTYTQQL